MDAKTKDRLVKLLGMMGSDHDGEVVNAARKVHAIVKENGWRWEDILGAGATSYTVEEIMRRAQQAAAGNTSMYDCPDDDEEKQTKSAPQDDISHHEMAEWLIDNFRDKLRDRELEFVEQMIDWRYPSPKQAAWLRRIYVTFGGTTRTDR